MAKKNKKSNLTVIDRDPPNLILVGVLQHLLDLAKKGEIYGALVVTESKNQGSHIVKEVSDQMRMIGNLEYAKMQLLVSVASQNAQDATLDGA